MGDTELLSMLAAEAGRRTPTIIDGLEALAASGEKDSARIEELRVEAHGLKGAALVVGQDRLADLAKRMEQFLAGCVETRPDHSPAPRPRSSPAPAPSTRAPRPRRRASPSPPRSAIRSPPSPTEHQFGVVEGEGDRPEHHRAHHQPGRDQPAADLRDAQRRPPVGRREQRDHARHEDAPPR